MTNPKVKGVLILDKNQAVVESTFDQENEKLKKFEEKCKTVIPNFTENARSTIRNLNPLVPTTRPQVSSPTKNDLSFIRIGSHKREYLIAPGKPLTNFC